MMPGRTVRPRASISCAAPGRSGPMALMRPSSTAMSTAITFSAVTTLPPRTTRSVKVTLPLFEKMHSGVECSGHIFDQHIFIRMMADAAGRAQEQHGCGDFGGENHGIVPGATGQVVNGIAGSFYSLSQPLHQSCIHGDCGLVELLLLFELQATISSNLSGFFEHAVDRLMANCVLRVADIEAGADAAGNHIARVRLNLQAPDGGDESGGTLSNAFYGRDPSGCRGQRVTP